MPGESALALAVCVWVDGLQVGMRGLEIDTWSTVLGSDLDSSKNEVPDGDIQTAGKLHICGICKLVGKATLTSLRLCQAAASVAMHALLQ